MRAGHQETSSTLQLTQPATRAELDIPFSMITELMLKRTMLEETTSTYRVARNLGISVAVAQEAFEELRGKKYLDVKSLQGDEYIFSLTSSGYEQAMHRYQRCSYATIAPVSLEAYIQVVKAQRAQVAVSRELIAQGLSDLVLGPDLLDRVGPAFNSQNSVFLYGPTGTGKTSIAERLVRLYEDAVVIPRAVEVDGQVITLFDPVVHHAIEHQPTWLDPRWVACKRPLVVVGGELVPSMLQLYYDAGSGVYSAPLQMKANNGMLLIDDFGRQLMPPEALLNRWIVPLDRRVDYLSLNYGVKFQIPFELMVVFSTNLDPSKLGDEAFFRRIENKIFIGPITEDEFDHILARAAHSTGIELLPGIAASLRQHVRRLGDGTLRPCYPWDICRLVRVICEYEKARSILDERSIGRALELYFAVGSDGESGWFSGSLHAHGVTDIAVRRSEAGLDWGESDVVGNDYSDAYAGAPGR